VADNNAGRGLYRLPVIIVEELLRLELQLVPIEGR
jgi:hypothetical protein